MSPIIYEAILGLQKWCLAYYKKEFVTERNHPPLGYFARIIKIGAHPDLPPKPLGCVKFSPDIQESTGNFDEHRLMTAGRFYREGYVIIELDYEEKAATCKIYPGPDISIEKLFAHKN